MKHIKNSAIVFLFIFTICILASCGGSSSSQNSVPSETILAPGIITGKVVADQASGLFKTSFAVSPDQTPVVGALCSLADNPSISSTTDQDGIFRLVNVSLGLHLVVCTKTDPSGNKFAVLQAVEIVEGKGSDLGFIALRKTGHIRGSVKVTGLVDLIGIDVFIPGTSFIAKTDNSGGFSLSDIPDGTHTLRVQKDVHRFQDVPNIQVVSGQTTNVGVIEINFSNRTASITSTAPTQITVLTDWSYNVVALDPDQDPLTLSVATGPSEMVVTGMTVNWNPTCVQVGTNTITISVSDAFGGVVTQSFIVTVVNPNEGAVPENPCRSITLLEGPSNSHIRAIAVDSTNLYATFGQAGSVLKVPFGQLPNGLKCLSNNQQSSPIPNLTCDINNNFVSAIWHNSLLVTSTRIFFGGANCCLGNSPSIQTTPLDLSTVSTLSSLDTATSLVVDDVFVYWVVQSGFGCSGACTEFSGTTNHGVFKVPIAGGSTLTLADLLAPNKTELGNGMGIAIDNAFVYWTEQRWQISEGTTIKHLQGDVLRRASKVDGNGQTTLVAGLDEPWSLKIKDGVLYWAEMGGKSLKKVDASCIAPCTPITLVSSGKRIIDLEVDDVYVYWIEEGPNGTVNRVLQTGGTPEIISSSEFPTDITQDATYIYWAEFQNVSGPPPFKIRRAIK